MLPKRIWQSFRIRCFANLRIGQIDETRQERKTPTEKKSFITSQIFFNSTSITYCQEYLYSSCFLLAHLEAFSYIASCKIIRITSLAYPLRRSP